MDSSTALPNARTCCFPSPCATRQRNPPPYSTPCATELPRNPTTVTYGTTPTPDGSHATNTMAHATEQLARMIGTRRGGDRSVWTLFAPRWWRATSTKVPRGLTFVHSMPNSTTCALPWPVPAGRFSRPTVSTRGLAQTRPLFTHLPCTVSRMRISFVLPLSIITNPTTKRRCVGGCLTF